MRDDAGSTRSADRVAERFADRFAEQVFAREPFDAGDASARLRVIHQKLAAALRPVVGDHGFDAMFVTSVRTTRTRHPELGPAPDAAGEASLDTFWSAVHDADAPLVMELERTLLTTFFVLVADFIGPELALRLFHEAWPSVELSEGAEYDDLRRARQRRPVQLPPFELESPLPQVPVKE